MQLLVFTLLAFCILAQVQAQTTANPTTTKTASVKTTTTKTTVVECKATPSETKHLWTATASSSSDSNHSPSYAVDNIVQTGNIYFWNSGFENYAWLQVNLAQTYLVLSVIVQDRLDEPSLFSRFKQAEVRVGSTDVSSATPPSQFITVNTKCGKPQTYSCNTMYTYHCPSGGIEGMFVSVQKLAESLDTWHVNELTVVVQTNKTVITG